MKRIACFLVVAISSLALPASGGVRPRYGGTLRVQMSAPLGSLDPADSPSGAVDAVARARVTALLFDTLVWTDAEGRAHPQLAVAWRADPSFKRWQFWLRPGVRFTDGTALTADAVAGSLSGRNSWTAKVSGEWVVIETETARPDLLAELALSRNAVVKRGTAGLIGTGPFLVKNFVAAKSLELGESDASWGGRPFVDAVQIEFGKSPREQMINLQLGKVDWIEVGAEQIGKVESEGRKAQISLPVELVALVGGPGRGRELQALSLAIDRKSIQSLLLRGGSEAAGGVLPEWMSGTDVLFPIQVNVEQGRKAMTAGSGTPAPARAVTLSYDSSDALAKLLSERVALNAREIGLTVQVTSSATSADLRLERITLGSSHPGVALTEIGRTVGTKVNTGLSAPGEIYLAERKLMEEAGVVPLFHLPLAWLVGERVRGASTAKLGAWPLEGVWLETGP